MSNRVRLPSKHSIYLLELKNKQRINEAIERYTQERVNTRNGRQERVVDRINLEAIVLDLFEIGVEQRSSRTSHRRFVSSNENSCSLLQMQSLAS